ARLIHRYFDDSLDSGEERELVDSLEQSADARRQFVDAAFLNYDLLDAMREADMRSFIVSGEDEAAPEPATQPAKRPARRFYSLALRGGLAAAVLVAVALSIPGVLSKKAAPDKDAPEPVAVAGQPEQPAQEADELGSGVSVGTLVQQRDCKWVDGSNVWR